MADFETGDLSQIKWIHACCDDSVTVVASPVRAGNHALQFDVRATDPPVINNNHRAEAGLGPNVMGEYWYGWSTYIPADWQSPKFWHFLTNWHANAGPEPLLLSTDGVTIGIGHEYGGIDDIPKHNVSLWNTPVAPYLGKWMDWVVHANWREDSSGYIQVWLNGKQILNWHPSNGEGSITPGGGNIYWKGGLYYPLTDTNHHLFYLDEMRMGDASSSYAEVAPPALSQPPVCPPPPAPVLINECVTAGAIATCTAKIQ